MKRLIKSTKRLVALFISLLMVVSVITACGGNTGNANTSTESTKSTVTTESTSAVQALKEVTLKFFLRGDDRSSKNEVLDALYEQTNDRLNAKFEFNFVPTGDYANKLTMMQAAGDSYDASFTAEWNVYPMMVNKGAYLPLTTYWKNMLQPH